MKITILKENLTKSLSKINRIISTKTQLPILNNVLLKASKNQLILEASNLETAIKDALGAKVEKEGAFSVPARLLSEYIISLPAEKVSLEKEKNQLSITCKNNKAAINGLFPDEFPPFPSFSDKPFLSLNAKQFSQIINSVAMAATSDDSRPVLNGVLFDFNEKSLSFVSTDGYRLSFKKIDLSSPKDAKNIIVPATSLSEVQKNISEEKNDQKKLSIFQTKDQNQLVFQFKDTLLATRLIDGQFPNYQKIIPEKSTTSVQVDTQQFQKAVKIAAIFARESANVIKIEKQKNTLIITSDSPQLGQNKTELEIKAKGEDLKTAFNSRYLLDFLNIVPSDSLSLELSGPLSPGVFKIPNSDSFLHLIMPVRLQEES